MADSRNSTLGDGTATTNATRPDSSSAVKSAGTDRRKRSNSPIPSIETGYGEHAGGAASRDRKKRKRDDSPEDGEASSDSSAASPASSLHSAPMSESETESSPEEIDDDPPLFPIENKYKSEADKADILALPEIKREEILADRAAQLEQEQQNRYLRQLLKVRVKDDGKAEERKKRKLPGAEVEDESRRKSSRQKTTLGGRKEGETSIALEQYKRQREQRGVHNEQRRREEDPKGKTKKAKHAGDDGFSDRDADGDSEVEYSTGKDKVPAIEVLKPEPAIILPATLRDFERCRLGNHRFAEVCFYPGFEEAITGCFARVCVGEDKATRTNKYVMCQIKGFKAGRPYAVIKENGSKIVTDSYVVGVLGNTTREYPFIACSNSRFIEDEFRHYKREQELASLPVPTLAFLTGKSLDVDRLIRRPWTEVEITEKLQRQNKILQRFFPVERTAIKSRRDEAVRSGNEAEVARCDAELAAMEGPKLAFGTSLAASPSKPKEKGQQERLAEINKRNRKANIESVRKAQLRERRDDMKMLAAVARGEAVPDTFKRVKTVAKIHYDSSADGNLTPRNVDSDRSRGGTPAGGTPGMSTPTRGGTPTAPLLSKRTTVGGLPSISRPITDDEYLASMDFGIDIEL